MAIQNVRDGRFSTLPGVTIPGSRECVLVAGSYIMYITNNAGERVPPAVMAHGHDISDVSGLQTALDGKSPSTHTHSLATTTVAGFMSAADKVKLDASVNYTHPTSGVTAGTYRSVTVNALGHVTAGTNPTTLAGYGLTDRFISTNPTLGVSVDTLNATNINNLSFASQFFVTAGVNTPVGAASSGYTHTSATGSTSFFQMYFDPAAQDAFYFRRKNTSVVYAWEQVASRTYVNSLIPLDANNYVYRGTYQGFDADLLTQGGWYDNGAGTPTTTNLPVAKPGFFNVTPYRAGAFNAVAQDFFTSGTGTNLNRRFYRTSWAGTYTAWLEVASREWANGVFSPLSHSHDWASITGKPTSFVPVAHTLDSHSNVTISSPTAGQLLRYNGSSWANWTPTFSSTDTWDNVMVRGATSSVAATIGLAAGSRNYLLLQPANYGTGVPRFSIAKGLADNLWQVYAHDGTSAMGVINLNAANIQHNGVDLVTTARVIGTGSGLIGGGNLGGNLSLSVNFGNAAGTVAQGNDFRIINGNTAYLWGNHASANYYSASNPNGYISGINSGMVTSALGYTPASSGLTLTINGIGKTLTGNQSWDVASGVTQVGLVVPTGFTVTSSPVTGNGNISFAFASGYSLVSSTDRANWNAAGGVGSGTASRLVKWNPSGNALEDSRIHDGGTGNIAINANTTVNGTINITSSLNAGSIHTNGNLSTSGNLVLSSSNAALVLANLSESQLGSIPGLTAGMIAYVSSGSGHGFWGYYGSSIGWRILATRVWSGGGGAP